MALLGRNKQAAEPSDRQLRDRVAEAERVVRETHRLARSGRGTGDDFLAGIAATESVRAGRAELLTRHVRRSAASAAGRSPLAGLAQRHFSDEIAGTALDSRRLTSADVKEAKRLLRLDGLAGRDAKSAEALIDLAAGERGFVKRRRREITQAEERKREAKRLHLSMLPRRRDPEPGSIELPAFLWSWITDGRDDTFDVGDLGLLAGIMFSFANDDPSLFSRGRMEREDRGPSIVVRDAAHAVSLKAGAGWVNVRGSLERLRVNRWVETEKHGGVLRIRPGERLAKILGDVAR